jgi:phosphoglycerol transferase MdoB-like AlkP superfamily enzyme
METRWNRFFVQVQRDFRLWLFIMLGLSLFRLVFLVVFRAQLDVQSGGREILLTLLNGLRFDAMVGAWWIIPPLLMSASCTIADLQRAAGRVRTMCGVAFVVAISVLGCASVEYFREFNDVFNPLLFKLQEDDTAAILTTIYSEYHLVRHLALAAGLIGAGVLVQRRFFAREFVGDEVFRRVTRSALRRNLANVLIVLLFVVAVRGSITSRPVQAKDAAITADRLLNKAVLNPLIALNYAVRDHQKTLGGAGLKTFLPDGNVVRACEEAFPQAPARENLDQYMERTAAGPKTAPPRHIFIIDSESYDAWPLLDEYQSLGVAREGRRLAREGLHVKAFLPASDGSMAGFIAMIAGLPHPAIPTQYEPSARTPYPTSLPVSLKKLGYRTRFFAGGYLSWCNVGDLAWQQGFEEVYGAAHIAQWSATNEWGVKDEYLFDFVRRKVTDDTPSFNVIMTCTYHAPFDLDLKAKGCPLTEVPADLKDKFQGDVPKLLTVFGHRWYADRCIGEFVAQSERELPRALFVLSGDHYGRHFINHAPTAFERSAVPLILYGKEVLKGLTLPEGVAGSHVDIPPTVIELTAPKGFKYHAVGQDLLTPRKQFLGCGEQNVIGCDFLLDLKEGSQICAVPGRQLPREMPDVERLTRLHHAIHGVAWWRVRRGPELPGPIFVADAPGTMLR